MQDKKSRIKRINWAIFPWASLNTSDLYDILALREEVFMLEQKCNAIDLDGLDKHAIHVVGKIEGKIVATARILPSNIYKKDKVSFGRLAIKQNLRGQGYGDELIQIITQYIAANFKDFAIEFSAQLYLRDFYEKHGFVAIGDVYDEGGIAHVNMVTKEAK